MNLDQLRECFKAVKEAQNHNNSLNHLIGTEVRFTTEVRNNYVDSYITNSSGYTDEEISYWKEVFKVNKAKIVEVSSITWCDVCFKIELPDGSLHPFSIEHLEINTKENFIQACQSK